MDTGRMSPGERASEEYYAAAAKKLQQELWNVINHTRAAHAAMSADAFKRHLRGIGMDETAARDFLDSDGSVESMTSRMWVYFESPLRPRCV